MIIRYVGTPGCLLACRSCTVEKAHPGDVFEVPRTALLLTGQMQIRMPVKDSTTPSGGVAAITAAASVGPPAAEIIRGGSPTGSYTAGRSSSSSSNGGSDHHGVMVRAAPPPLGSQSLPAVAVRGSWEELPSPSVKQHKQLAAVSSAPILVAPAELPPGDYLCITEAILLQVPWGPDIPTNQQTASYQAQVLSKGSIHLGPRGAGASGSGELNELAKMSSPLKGVLSRISKGLTRTQSDTIPSMPHLQTALDRMRQERTAAGGKGRNRLSSDSLGSRSLHTLYEAPHTEQDAVSRLRKTSAGSVSTPTYASSTPAVQTATTAAGVHAAGGAAGIDIEMGMAGSSRVIAAATAVEHQDAAAAAGEGRGSSERTAAPAAVLPRATDVLGQQQPTGLKHSRSFHRSSLQ